MSLALAVAGWLAAMWLLWRFPAVSARPAGRLTDAAVSVVIPARDEDRNLPRLLGSLAEQSPPPREVVVVDDDSSDATASVAAAAGARVVPSGGPPPGWTGKAWACAVGASAASGDVLVLLDADTWLGPGALGRLVDAHGELAAGGLLSVQPHHETRCAYEQVSAVGNLVAVLASGAAAAVPLRRRPVAFGPCMVTAPGALERVGGFAAVRHDVVEDIALARRYRAVGLPVRCLRGGDAVRYRMYPDGWRALVEGWTKNLAAGAALAPAAGALGAALWVAGALSVAVGVVAGPSWVVGAAWGAYAAQAWWMLRRLGSFHWWTWAVFPVAVAAFVGLTASSAVALARGRARWRGRQVTLGR